jgi:hypothetical protein
MDPRASLPFAYHADEVKHWQSRRRWVGHETITQFDQVAQPAVEFWGSKRAGLISEPG